ANKYTNARGSLSTYIAVANMGRDPYCIFQTYIFSKNYSYITSAWIKLIKTTVDEYENGNRVRTNFTEYTYNEATGSQNEFKSILPVSVTTGTSMAKDDE